MRILVAILLLAAACGAPVPPETPAPAPEATLDPDFDPEARLAELGITLPSPGAPIASYVNAVRSGDLLFLAGKGPTRPDGTSVTGRLGDDLSVEDGYEAARLTAIQHLAVLEAELGDLRRVRRVVKVTGMVNAAADFTKHSAVINGYSDLMAAVFGDRGLHARAAVGMASLPTGIAVEVEAVVEVE
jgi:enamine deaminase RidA (YjgF/YER057c/UK114 family)